MQDYTNEQLQKALSSMLDDSSNIDYDARHIFGHGQPDHQLSKLQIITATRILDYQEYMVSCVTMFFKVFGAVGYHISMEIAHELVYYRINFSVFDIRPSRTLLRKINCCKLPRNLPRNMDPFWTLAQ